MRKQSSTERFWSKVERGPDCWLWTASRYTVGYGQVWYNGKITGAHRVAWELTHGPIPDGLYVCHTCDVRACCNPAHLWLATQKDNLRDMTAKGRRAVTTPKGERHAFARLTDDLVRTLRQRRAEGWTYTRLAADFGISQPHAYRIANRQKWKHVI